MMRLLYNSLQIVRAHRRAYITLNLAYYSLVLSGMAYSLFHPGYARGVGCRPDLASSSHLRRGEPVAGLSSGVENDSSPLSSHRPHLGLIGAI